MSRAIAVIGGTGPQGAGLALRWTRAGETVIIGSRDAGRAQGAAEKIRESVGTKANISGMENAAACAATDLLVLTVPFEGQAELMKQLKPALRPGSILIPQRAVSELQGKNFVWIVGTDNKTTQRGVKVAGQVGETADGEMRAVHSAQCQRVTGHLHDRGVHPALGHRREHCLQCGSFRGGQ